MESFIASVTVSRDALAGVGVERAVAALCQVLPGTTPSRARALTELISTDGRITIWEGPRATAELYARQLAGADLVTELH